MASLFVDTTYDITLGLLDDDLRWLEFKQFSGQKASSVIQKESYSLCKQRNIEVEKLSSLLTIAGPGFYTGLRLSEGLADVFSFFKIPHFAFYTYEIPLMCGFESGVWMTKAYRGEYFFHHWRGDEKKSILISSKELPDYLEGLENIFIHSESALDDLSREMIGDYTMTRDLLKERSECIFSKVIANKLARESFYFRAPEDEFRVSL